MMTEKGTCLDITHVHHEGEHLRKQKGKKTNEMKGWVPASRGELHLEKKERKLEKESWKPKYVGNPHTRAQSPRTLLVIQTIITAPGSNMIPMTQLPKPPPQTWKDTNITAQICPFKGNVRPPLITETRARPKAFTLNIYDQFSHFKLVSKCKTDLRAVEMTKKHMRLVN